MGVVFVPEGKFEARRGGRRSGSVASAPSVESDGQVDARKLQDVLVQMAGRIAELESKVQPDSMEFELVSLASPTIFDVRHNFNGPVRWWVMSFRSGASNLPSIRENKASSTKDTLNITMFTVAQVVIRVERAQHSLSP